MDENSCIAAVIFISAVAAPTVGAQERPPHPAVSVFFQADSLGSSCDALAGAVESAVIEFSEGIERAVHTVGVAISSEFGGCAEGLCRRCGIGVQGWSLSVGLDGDLELVDAVIEEVNPRVLCSVSFKVVEIVDPNLLDDEGSPQGPGVISAVVFFCGDNFVLNPGGTETVLGLTLASPVPRPGESVSGTLTCRPMRFNSARPTENFVTVDGQGFSGCAAQLEVRFVGAGDFQFRRCDADSDGVLLQSDAINLLEWMFRRGSAPPCIAAADCNADGRVNITDAVYALTYLFGGGSPPPLPFPDCGPSEFAADLALGCVESSCP